MTESVVTIGDRKMIGPWRAERSFGFSLNGTFFEESPF